MEGRAQPGGDDDDVVVLEIGGTQRDANGDAVVRMQTMARAAQGADLGPPPAQAITTSAGSSSSMSCSGASVVSGPVDSVTGLRPPWAAGAPRGAGAACDRS